MQVRPVRDPDDREAIARLVAETGSADGYPALTEDAALGMAHALAGLVALRGGRIVGYAHHMDAGAGTAVELVVHPAGRSIVAPVLLGAVAWVLPGAVARGMPWGTIGVWASDADTTDAALTLGFGEVRAVVQLVGHLPPTDRPRYPDGIEMGTFVPGRDETAFLELNAAAFGDHPDNSGWDEGTLRDRMSRDWFDPAGWFTARRGTRMVGACWTKVHAEGVGEIYWIAVHPDERGRSLGKALTLTGLHHLSRGCKMATLYTEAGNAPALRLYEGLGFRLLRVKRRLVR